MSHMLHMVLLHQKVKTDNRFNVARLFLELADVLRPVFRILENVPAGHG